MKKFFLKFSVASAQDTFDTVAGHVTNFLQTIIGSEVLTKIFQGYIKLLFFVFICYGGETELKFCTAGKFFGIGNFYFRLDRKIPKILKSRGSGSGFENFEKMPSEKSRNPGDRDIKNLEKSRKQNPGILFWVSGLLSPGFANLIHGNRDFS